MGVLPFPPSYRWRDLARPAALDLEPARRAATAILGDATTATVDRDAVEVAIERALVDHYGLWVVGWRWASSEVGGGGPIGAWCCAEHSVLPEDEPDPDATATIARVVAAVDEWWQLLGELARQFAALAAPTAAAPPAEPIERAATALLALAVERTRVEDAWFGTFAAFLRWYLDTRGHDPDRIAPIIDGALAGRLEPWCAPDAATARDLCAELGRALAAPAPAAAVDRLAAWSVVRDRRLLPAPIGYPRVAVRGDGHRAFIDRFDRARDPDRATRMHAAVDACRRSATAREPLRLADLVAWQTLALGAPAAIADAATVARVEAALADASDRAVPTAIRAARIYLDLCCFRPFATGHRRAARLALDHVLTSSGLALHVAAPLFALPPDPTDPRGLWRFTYLIERLVGRSA